MSLGDNNASSVSPNAAGPFNRSMVIGGTDLTTTTRRRWVSAVSAGFGLLSTAELFGASQFWNKKEASMWSSAEVLQLTTRSPWATTARVLPKRGRDPGGFDPTAPDLSGGNAGARSENRRLGDVAVVPVDEVTVVWESAQPLLDALKTTFPRDFANHYVIGVDDLPTAEGSRKVNLTSMAANLQVRGKGSIDAGGVLPSRSVTLFAFAKELLPLSATDKEVLFTLETNQYSIKARFDLKEMVYRGKLAL
jgi:hypothetical protein